MEIIQSHESHQSLVSHEGKPWICPFLIIIWGPFLKQKHSSKKINRVTIQNSEKGLDVYLTWLFPIKLVRVYPRTSLLRGILTSLNSSYSPVIMGEGGWTNCTSYCNFCFVDQLNTLEGKGIRHLKKTTPPSFCHLVEKNLQPPPLKFPTPPPPGNKRPLPYNGISHSIFRCLNVTMPFFL